MYPPDFGKFQNQYRWFCLIQDMESSGGGRLRFSLHKDNPVKPLQKPSLLIPKQIRRRSCFCCFIMVLFILHGEYCIRFTNSEEKIR